MGVGSGETLLTCKNRQTAGVTLKLVEGVHVEARRVCVWKLVEGVCVCEAMEGVCVCAVCVCVFKGRVCVSCGRWLCVEGVCGRGVCVKGCVYVCL